VAEGGDAPKRFQGDPRPVEPGHEQEPRSDRRLSAGGDGPIVSIQDGGTFPFGPASCGIEAFSQASIAVQPFTGLFAQANAEEEEPNAHGSAAEALAAMQYDFTVTGGQPGDLVPVLVLTCMETQAGTSDFPNDSNIASALVDVRALSP